MRLKKQQSFSLFRVVLLVSFILVLLLLVSNLLLVRRMNRIEESLQALEKRQTALDLEISSVTGIQRTMKVSLYYYNELLDRALNGDISCDTAAVIPVERTIAYTQAPINDVIRLLIRGELTKAEKDMGFKTEFPGRELLFQGARLDNGVLYLKFSDPAGFTTGGFCRVELLRAQIEKTAMQFETVKRVVFEPATLFQP